MQSLNAEHREYCFEEVKKQVIHYPSLKTVLMVEELIEKKGEFKNKRQLWEAMPKGIMYQTLIMVLAYLEHSGKIIIDRDGSILWIWNPKLANKVLGNGTRKL